MADRWGVDDRYVDAAGNEVAVPDATVERLRGLIGEPVEGGGPIVLRPGRPYRLGRGTIALEDGSTVTTTGRAPDDLPVGYHTFTPPTGESLPLIVSPGRCHLPIDRAWGWAAQLYAARSSRSWGIGDLADLQTLTRTSESRGAGFVLINPVGAVCPAGPQQASPYFPASRLFRNPIYLRVEDVAGAADAPAVEQAASEGRALNSARLIDRDRVWSLKRRALEAIWEAGPPSDEFERWYEQQPAALRQFATWAVLAELHGGRWRDWPGDCRRPDGAGVARAADEYFGRTRFHAWLQWLVGAQLGEASRHVPVMQDLPIGVDPDGFDAWLWQDLIASEVSVGAPADEFNSQGQNWGLPPFVPWRLRAAGYTPFIQTIRAVLGSGGALRIDHVMGLFRLWWIPEGAAPNEGAYVRYAADDLLAIVAIESQRAGAVVVGEDLGTVEEDARQTLADHDVLSYRLLWFEEDEPAAWPAKALAAVTTHDLPTVAGLWDGSDVAEQRRLGLSVNEEGTEAIRERLRRDGDLAEDAATKSAVAAAHRLLAESPSLLLAATLDDAFGEPARPNIPGTDDQRPNWSLALPVELDELDAHPLAGQLVALLDHAAHGTPGG